MRKILRDPTALGDLLKGEEAEVPMALTRNIKMAMSLAEGTTKLRFGGACMKSKIPEVNLKSRVKTPKTSGNRGYSNLEKTLRAYL